MVSFGEFAAAIQALAEADHFTDKGVPYCDPWDWHWRDAFCNGCTPDEAWQEHKAELEGMDMDGGLDFGLDEAAES